MRETTSDSDRSRTASESDSVVSDETLLDMFGPTDTVHLSPIGAAADNPMVTYDRLESVDGTLGLQVSFGAYAHGGDPVLASPGEGPCIIARRSEDALESSARR